MTRFLIQWAVVSCVFVTQSLRAADEASTPARTAPRAIVLPDYCNTPDAMAVLPDKSIILSVPNFTDPGSPGVLMKISPQDEVALFCKLPLHPQTGQVFPKTDKGAVLSGVYRFRLDERDLWIKPGSGDAHLLATLETVCQDIPVGADGIDFDEQGQLYIANCGDAIIEKFVLSDTGQVAGREALTVPGQMKSADGIFYDRATRRIYVADILANAIRAVHLDGRVETVAENGDSDGSAGQLDGPSEAVVRGNELIAANFDRVFPGCVNTHPDKPYTLAVIRRGAVD